MVYYVTARDTATAKKVAEKLQAENLTDCYISPLTALSCLKDINIPPEAKTALRLDLLTVCDALIVKCPISDDMQTEISLARKINMEVIYIDC